MNRPKLLLAALLIAPTLPAQQPNLDFLSNHVDGRKLREMLSRPEVDPKRVGITGNSGGGTHTAYIASLDDRLAVAAAPEGEAPVPPASEAELACTKTGQVATSLGGETVYTLTRAHARAIQTPVKPSLEEVRRFAGLRADTAAPPVRISFRAVEESAAGAYPQLLKLNVR